MRSTIHAEIVAAKAQEKHAFYNWQAAIKNTQSGEYLANIIEDKAFEQWQQAGRRHDHLLNELLGDSRRLLIENGN